jgi:hypothetical protein
MPNTHSRKFLRSSLLAAAYLLLALPAGYAQTADERIAAMSERLQALEDKEAIRTLLEHYIELNESRDWRAYSRLFASNGELVMRRGTESGPDNILQMMEKNFGGDAIGPDSPLYRSTHLLSNIQINVNGDTATAVSRWTLLVPDGEDVPRASQAGKYRDTLVKENGEWKFKQRVVARDIPAP